METSIDDKTQHAVENSEAVKDEENHVLSVTTNKSDHNGSKRSRDKDNTIVSTTAAKKPRYSGS